MTNPSEPERCGGSGQIHHEDHIGTVVHSDPCPGCPDCNPSESSEAVYGANPKTASGEPIHGAGQEGEPLVRQARAYGDEWLALQVGTLIRERDEAIKRAEEAEVAWATDVPRERGHLAAAVTRAESAEASLATLRGATQQLLNALRGYRTRVVDPGLDLAVERVLEIMDRTLSSEEGE